MRQQPPNLIAGVPVILSRLIDDIERRRGERQRMIAELETTRSELAAAIEAS